MTSTQAALARSGGKNPEVQAYRMLSSLFGEFSSRDLLRRELECRASVHKALVLIWGVEQNKRFTTKIANLLRDPVRAWERKLAGGLWPDRTKKPEKPWSPVLAEAMRIGNAIHCLLAAALAEGIDIDCAEQLVRRQLKRPFYPEYEQSVAMELRRIDDVVAWLASAVALRNDKRMKESWEAIHEAWRRATKGNDDEPGKSPQWAWDWSGPGGGAGPGPGGAGAQPGPGGGARPRPEGRAQPPAPPEIARFQSWWLEDEKAFRTFLLVKLEVEMAYRALCVGGIAWPKRAEKAMVFLKRARLVIDGADEALYLCKAISDEITVLEFALAWGKDIRRSHAVALFGDVDRVENGEVHTIIRDVTHKLDEHKSWPEWMSDKAKLYEALAKSQCEQVLRSTDEGVVVKSFFALRQSLDAIENVGRRIEFIESILAHLASHVEMLKGRGSGGWDAVAAICIELLGDLAPQGHHVLITVRNFLAEILAAEVAGRVPRLCKAVSCWPVPPRRNRNCRYLHEEMQKLCQQLEAR